MNLLPAPLLGAGGEGQIVGFRPEHIMLRNGRGDAVTFYARVEVIEYLGDEQLVHLALRDTHVEAKLGVEEQVDRGGELEFSVSRDKLRLFDADTGERVRRT
jgi:ABC-type sugar transport system ATPase subunit